MINQTRTKTKTKNKKKQKTKTKQKIVLNIINFIYITFLTQTLNLRKLANFPLNKSISNCVSLLIYLLETSIRYTAFCKSSKEVPKLTHPCAFPVSFCKISKGFNCTFEKCLQQTDIIN